VGFFAVGNLIVTFAIFSLGLHCRLVTRVLPLMLLAKLIDHSTGRWYSISTYNFLIC